MPLHIVKADGEGSLVQMPEGRRIERSLMKSGALWNALVWLRV
jgi:hypothetical protein